MCDWQDCLGSGAQGRVTLDEQPERLIGWDKSTGTIKTYNRCFRRWAAFRELQDKSALITPIDETQEAGRGVLRFPTLHHGPLQKSAETAELHMQAFDYMPRLHTGLDPLNKMFRAKLFLQGARRDEGPPNRKLPAPCGDLIEIYHRITPGCIDEGIILCVILIGRYFMLRKSEYLGPGVKGTGPNKFRHSIRAMDLEEYLDSKRVPRGPPCDSVSLHIHGRKTDWLNCDTVRTHGALPPRSSKQKNLLGEESARVAPCNTENIQR